MLGWHADHLPMPNWLVEIRPALVKTILNLVCLTGKILNSLDLKLHSVIKKKNKPLRNKSAPAKISFAMQLSFEKPDF
jgi:hypothetical protein